MADEDIVISLDDDDSTEIRTPDGQKDEAVSDLKSQFETLKAETEAERKRAQDADRRAADAIREANRAREEVRSARTEVADRELDTVVSGIAAAQAEAEKAESDYAAAAESGDFRKMAEAQRRVARAEAKLGRLDEAKADLEVRRAGDGRVRSDESRPRAETRPADRASPDDPVEAIAGNLSPRSADWVRKHREVAATQKSWAKVMAAHHDALANDLAPDSDAYFSHVEQFIGLKDKPNGNGRAQNGSGDRQRRASAPAAPVSNAAGGSSAGGGTDVRLSPHEAAAAVDGTVVWNPGNRHPKTGEPIKHGDPLVGQPVGHREFARRKLAQQRQGLNDRVFVEQ